MNEKPQPKIKIIHNLDPNAFTWLWMKYVTGVNDEKHCTNCIRGKYGKLLSGHNDRLTQTPVLVLDEQPSDSYSAIYICGVIKKGYPQSNYCHNLHTVIQPQPGAEDSFEFENWKLKVQNGVFLPIPSEDKLPAKYKTLPPQFTTCRIFRWAVCSSLKIMT